MTDASALYDDVAQAAAEAVIERYSTSFSGAARLLGPRVRPHVRAVYALVRVADEIVDGPGRGAHADQAALLAVVDDYERRTLEAVELGFSTDLVIHAFAQTARECAIAPTVIRPFFDAMRTDVSTREHDRASHGRYVYGSAEVVGLMCLQVFLNAGFDRRESAPASLQTAARRLGAAFQNINFLRDEPVDRQALDRDYLGAVAADRATFLAGIRRDLFLAAQAIPSLPPDCRGAVAAAHDLFAALCDRLETDSGAARRIRVPDAQKALIVARAALTRRAHGVSA